MALYVLAFTDADLGSWTRGRRTVRSVRLGTIYAVCERRSVVPEAREDVLRAQHEAVIEIARRSRATLPVRFGTLMSARDLAAWARQREDELRRALTEVRDHVQMTIRAIGEAVPSVRPPRAMSSGREYLESRRQMLVPRLPDAAQDVLQSVRPFVTRERIEAGQGGLLATVYHLVHKRRLASYRRAVKRVPPDVIVSGPWPPFAFAPRFS